MLAAAARRSGTSCADKVLEADCAITTPLTHQVLQDNYAPGVKDDARRAVAALLVAIAGVAAGFAAVAAAGHPGWLIACIVIAVVPPR
jgi:hypothetical protein